jgi:hypothetical protein
MCHINVILDAAEPEQQPVAEPEEQPQPVNTVEMMNQLMKGKLKLDQRINDLMVTALIKIKV